MVRSLLVVLNDLRAELARRQLPCGGWSALASSPQPALEPTCYSLLALGAQATDVRERAQSFLLHAQNPNGCWAAVAADGYDGGSITSLVAIVLRGLISNVPARYKGPHCMVRAMGDDA